MSEHFTGDQKHLDHYLRGYEKQLIAFFLPLVPRWMNTVHLTLMSFLWAALVIVFGYWANHNIHWLWAFSGCIFWEHITDMLDGEVGRLRNEGLIKWGFYMDHFLDYVFICGVIMGYAMLLTPDYLILTLICMAVSGAFMVHTCLDFGITNDFKISFNRIGVAEIRCSLIVFNVLLIIFGKGILPAALKVIIVGALFVLGLVVYKSQQGFRKLDFSQREQRSKQ